MALFSRSEPFGFWLSWPSGPCWSGPCRGPRLDEACSTADPVEGSTGMPIRNGRGMLDVCLILSGNFLLGASLSAHGLWELWRRIN